MTEPQPPPQQGRVLNAINATKSLSLFNVLVIALLVLIAVPVYVVYRALSDDALLDRFLSSYRELPSDSGCTIRVVAERGGPERWSISRGWAMQGNDRWTVGVIVPTEPTTEQISAFCQSLTLISDQILGDHDGSSDPPAVEQ